MQFSALEIPAAMLIRGEPFEDSRGGFDRIFSADEFAANGLPHIFAYAALSTNRKAGTLRGLHYQLEPQEAKLVRCVRGAAYDVIVDLRPESPRFGQWRSVMLSEDQPLSVFVPKGCAHGFQTLVDGSELLYHIDAPFNPSAAAGIRWDDPGLGVEWPLLDPILSDRDRALPFLR
jgi:dTDP-4-dehydrorhamnose 3,5-epimerase